MSELTKEAILNAQGILIDEWIASKIFGWEILPFPATPRLQRPTADGVECLYNIPRYSIEIAAAWEVLERLYPIDVTLHFHIFGDGFWYATLFNGVRKETGAAPTAPLAICRAALLFSLK